MNFAKDTTVVTVAYWPNRLGLLTHQFKRFEKYGRPDTHIIWLNNDDAGLQALCEEYADRNPGTFIINSGNIYDLPAYDSVVDMIETPYFLGMSEDISVKRAGWMEEFESIAPFDMAGVEGEDARMIAQYLGGNTNHVRSGMTVIKVDSFKQVGKFISPEPIIYDKSTMMPFWVLYEVGLSVKMFNAGMVVKAMPRYPLWDYDNWGKRTLVNTLECSDEELNYFDEIIHMERCPGIALNIILHTPRVSLLTGYLEGDESVHLTPPFDLHNKDWDWYALCGGGLMDIAPAGTQWNPIPCEKCHKAANELEQDAGYRIPVGGESTMTLYPEQYHTEPMSFSDLDIHV